MKLQIANQSGSGFLDKFKENIYQIIIMIVLSAVGYSQYNRMVNSKQAEKDKRMQEIKEKQAKL